MRKLAQILSWAVCVAVGMWLQATITPRALVSVSSFSELVDMNVHPAQKWNTFMAHRDRWQMCAPREEKLWNGVCGRIPVEFREVK